MDHLGSVLSFSWPQRLSILCLLWVDVPFSRHFTLHEETKVDPGCVFEYFRSIDLSIQQSSNLIVSTGLHWLANFFLGFSNNMLIRFLLTVLIISSSVTPPAVSQIDNKKAVLWCDPLMNIDKISSRNGIITILNKARNSGFEAIALGVKTITGEVIFKSNFAPRLLDWKNTRLPVDIDVVQTFLNESRIRNLQVYAVFSLFSEGHMLERRGPIYNDHPNWQTTVYVVEAEEKEPKVMPITEWGYGATAFANPLLKEVQDYQISLVAEFLQKYKVDGIVFDKARFSGIESDFSDYSKQQFEQFLGQGQKLHWWPDDVYQLQFINEEWEIAPGQLFRQWVEFRSKSIQSFFRRLIDSVRQIDSSLPISNFVGAWYPTYYEYGVNWSSETNIPEEDWASRDYYKTALAELFDSLVVGCFFPRITIEEAENVNADWWMSVEGSSIVANEVVNGARPVYASIMAEQFKANGDEFKKAMETAANLTDGLYVYDFSQVEKHKFWDEIKVVLLGEQEGNIKIESLNK